MFKSYKCYSVVCGVLLCINIILAIVNIFLNKENQYQALFCYIVIIVSFAVMFSIRTLLLNVTIPYPIILLYFVSTFVCFSLFGYMLNKNKFFFFTDNKNYFLVSFSILLLVFYFPIVFDYYQCHKMKINAKYLVQSCGRTDNGISEFQAMRLYYSIHHSSTCIVWDDNCYGYGGNLWAFSQFDEAIKSNSWMKDFEIADYIAVLCKCLADESRYDFEMVSYCFKRIDVKESYRIATHAEVIKLGQVLSLKNESKLMEWAFMSSVFKNGAHGRKSLYFEQMIKDLGEEYKASIEEYFSIIDKIIDEYRLSVFHYEDE